MDVVMDDAWMDGVMDLMDFRIFLCKLTRFFVIDVVIDVLMDGVKSLSLMHGWMP